MPVKLTLSFWAPLLLCWGCRGYLRVCYYTNWSQFHPGPSRFLPGHVDPTLCTHIVFAFAEVRGTGIETTEFNDAQMYRRLAALKDGHPKLKVLLSVGGWRAGGAQFSALVASEDTMIDFVNNVIAFLRRYNLDGLDVDWEYPGDLQRGSEPADRMRYTRLLQLMRAGFGEEAEETGRDRLLLTAAVAAEIALARQYYQIPQIARSVDFINVMAYDFHGQWDLTNGARHHAALYPDTHAAVQGWLREGFPSEKLVLGTAAFARTFTLTARPTGTGVGQPAINVGLPSNFSDTEGLLTYQEICELLQTGGWQRVWLPEQQAPVAYGNLTGGQWGWAGYDDVESITAKANYIRENHLAGAMLWTMGHDDFNDHCGYGPWPLLTTIKNLLPEDNTTYPPESPPTFATLGPQTTSTISPPNPFGNNSTRWLPPLPRPTGEAESPEGRGKSPGRTTVLPGVYTPLPATPDLGSGYRQCNISDTFGPSLRCTSHHGKTGSRTKFYLYCFNGFFAIECSCLPGFFYNRCLQACDADSNFLACPFRY